MPGIEVVVQHAHVTHAGSATLDRDLIVPGADVRLRHGDIGGAAAWVNAVGIARGSRRVDFYAPGRKALAVGKGHMKIRRVLQRDAVQREVVRSIRYDQAWHLLPSAG